MRLDLALKIGQSDTWGNKNWGVVPCHEDNIVVPLVIMMNNRMHFLNSQSRLLRICRLEIMAEKHFLQLELTWECV